MITHYPSSPVDYKRGYHHGLLEQEALPDQTREYYVGYDEGERSREALADSLECEKSMPTKDVINRPSHYTHGSIQPIDAIEDWNLGFNLGNVVKYVARAGHKGSELEDLKKAAWYLNRMIQLLEGEEK